MKKFYISLAVVLICIVAVYAVVFFKKPNADTGVPQNPFGFGVGTTSFSNIGSDVALRLADGKTVEVSNFIPTNQPEGADAINGYEVVDEPGQGFSILFYPDSSGFLISLTQEPLGVTRRVAEKFLKSKINLSESELCKLNAQVFTSIETSETYAGRNLGLSFCEGAITLPQ